MPIISAFLGMLIKIYYNDHAPPHFHVEYGSMKAIVDINSGKIIKGKVPLSAKRPLEKWRKLNKEKLMKAWSNAQNGKQPNRIKPLE